MVTSESTMELLQALAKCIHHDYQKSCNPKQSSITPQFTQSKLQRAKHSAYDVLLLRSPSEDPIGFEPLEELRFIQFEMSLSDRERSNRFANCLDQMMAIDGGDASLLADSHRKVISFMLSLRDSIAPVPSPKTIKCGFGQRFPFKSYTNLLSHHYSRNPKTHTRLSCFDLNKTMERESAYDMKKLRTKRISSLSSISCEDQPNTLPVVQAITRKPIISDCHIKNPSWDSLNVPLDERMHNQLFSSESPEALLYIQRKRFGSKFSPHMLSPSQFIKDIKSLLLGIQTETFCFEEDNICFNIRPGVALLNGTPEAAAAVALEFIECGSCCARLKIMCDKNADFSYKFDGFIFKTLCGSVEEFLRFYEQFVDSFVDETVLGLSIRMSTLMLQISQMAKMLAIHPDVNQNPDLVPCGSEFLGYLHKEIIQMTNEDVATLFVYILQECCRVYFRFFEKWIFHGTMEDPSSELFIAYTECRPKTKHYWDKAYLIKPQSVPGFLHGFEHVTLLCGKYTMLLKEFRPNHPLLTVEPPSIDVCLSAAQIATLRATCLDYSHRIQMLCGQPISVNELFNRYAISKADFTRQATEKFHENMDKWRAEQAMKSDGVRAEHARMRAILERQITEVHDRKVQQRAENLELDRMYLANEERLEVVRVAEDDRRRLKRIEYYTELGELVDKQKSEADAKIASLTEKLEKETALTRDLENEITNEMSTVEITTVLKDTSTCVTQTETAKDHNKNEVIVLDNQPDAASTLSKLKKSPSDLLNANENAHDSASHNRMIQMGSTFDFQQHLTSANTNVTVRLHDDNSNSVISTDTRIESTNLAHLEMLQNRTKVMTQQYDLFAQMDSQLRPPLVDVDLEQMTDLQRNRQKVLSQEYGFPNKLAVSKKSSSDDDSKDTKTRGVPALRLNLVSSNDDELPYETPMSTSSDTPNQKFEDCLTLKEKPNLKLDIHKIRFPSSTSNLVTAVDKSASSVYESAQSEFNSSDNGDESVFVFPVKFNVPSPPKSNYIKSNESATHRFFHQISSDSIQPKKDLDELSNPNISSITHSLRMSFVLPLQAHLNVLNNEILKVFLLDLDLIAQFKSLRNYFLMMDGEFASQICQGLMVKLENNATPSEILNFSFLHSLLDNAIGSTIMGKDPNAEKLSFIVDDIPKQFDLTSPNVLNILNLAYSVEWPLNLLLSHETILRYGRIFQHLLKLRRIRFVLDETSQLLKDVAKRAGPRCLRSPQYSHVQQIRNQLLLFINGLQNHITANALQASWRRFKTELKRAQSIEDIYQMHTRYLKQVAFLCTINKRSKDFDDTLDKVWVISLRFYHKLKRFDWQFDANGIYTHPKYSSLVSIETTFNTLIPYIVHTGEKMSRRGYQPEIDDFLTMINFNGFYDRDRK